MRKAALLIAAGIAAYSSLIGSVSTTAPGYYSDLARVQGFRSGLVVFETSTGLMYSAAEEADIYAGEYYALTICDNGTPDYVLDDVVINFKYQRSDLF